MHKITRGDIKAFRLRLSKNYSPRTWKDVDSDKMEIHVRQAWKSDTELGEPKWGQKHGSGKNVGYLSGTGPESNSSPLF